MMAEHENTNELSEEQKLQLQLEEVCSEYQKLVTDSEEMAPKGTGAKRTDPTGENNVDDDDLEGISNFIPSYSLVLVFRTKFDFHI